MSIRNPLLVAAALCVLAVPAAYAKNPNRPTNQTILNQPVAAPVAAPVAVEAPAPVKKVKAKKSYKKSAVKAKKASK